MLDHRFMEWLTHQWGKFVFFDAWMMVVAEWNPTVMLVVIFLFTLGFGAHHVQMSSVWIAAGISIFSAFIGRVTNEPVGRLIQRLRPFEAMSFSPLVSHERGDSFPSNHATGAFALAVPFLFVSDYWVILFALALLLVISRMYVGLHFVTDIIAGLSVGMCVALFFSWCIFVV
ncbi:MAG: phosphatase PAP2 family protein [Alicyclobacillaceae bacterium]|nr:phosphatase PAP2 family protein [Alicyclobacillaceae bacterium]MCY0895075.1 phosphatase PAP2 family protein [Alicyclobacillaceae bacterium]